MTPTFVSEKKTLNFLVSHILASKVASLEHNCHIFRAKLPHLWNATCLPCGEESDFNTVTALI